MTTQQGLIRKINSASKLKGIITSQKTLSAVAISSYERADTAMRAYTKNIELGIQAALYGHSREGGNPLQGAAYHAKEQAIAIIIGSDLGLVGRFNKSLATYAKEHIVQSATVIAAGHNIANRLAPLGINPIKVFPMPSSAKAIAGSAEDILAELLHVIKSDTEISIFFNKKEGASARHEHKKIYPIDSEYLNGIAARKWPTKKQPMTSADPDEMLKRFIEQLIFSSLSTAISSSLAAEHHTRLTNLQAAERNIEDKIAEMRQDYQTQRQTEITEELIDVITGATVIS